MNRVMKFVVALVAGAMPAAAFASHSDLQVPPSQTFVLGGDQQAMMKVSGKNIGQTEVVVLSRTGSDETAIATVAAGASFEHEFAIGETALIRNRSSAKTAKISVDFTGSASSLSMSYQPPSK